METCINYLDETAFFSSDERRWATRIHRLKTDYPDQVTIIKEPEENDGCIYAKIPASWVRVQPKRRLSEESRKAASDRLQELRLRKLEKETSSFS